MEALDALAYAFRHASGNSFQISQETARRIAAEMAQLLARDGFGVMPAPGLSQSQAYALLHDAASPDDPWYEDWKAGQTVLSRLAGGGSEGEGEGG